MLNIKKMYQMIQYVPLLISVFKDTSNFNINSMESDKEVISRLKFIGKVQKGEKINVKYMFVQPEGIATRISRTLINQCNRQNTLNFVRNTIKRTFEIINNYRDSKNDSHRHICGHIIYDLKQSWKGIVNIKSTYINDLKVCCDLDTLLQEIEAFLTTIENDIEMERNEREDKRGHKDEDEDEEKRDKKRRTAHSFNNRSVSKPIDIPMSRSR